MCFQVFVFPAQYVWFYVWLYDLSATANVRLLPAFLTLLIQISCNTILNHKTTFPDDGRELLSIFFNFIQTSPESTHNKLYLLQNSKFPTSKDTFNTSNLSL